MFSIPIPANLPLLVGNDPYVNETIDKILKSDPTSEREVSSNLVALTRHWKVRVWFTEPVLIPARRGGYTTADSHDFGGFFISQSGSLCFTHSKHNRRGPVFLLLPKVVRYEPLLNSSSKFKSLDQFRKKFDPLFITETEILNLWNGKSSQHGGKYNKHDFRKLGPEGLRVVEKFLVHFKGLPNQSGEGYFQTYDNRPYLREEYKSYSSSQSFGRDISISHTAGCEYVHYSSEYPGCGNGRYGLLVNKTTFLHLEDD